ncbi:MAG: adenylosuccinate synthase [Anaerolineales bacterium]|nr:adenylosuccinate synthase [Anaerolineales bacterium]
MPVTILIGAQWGDEGKGRVVDWFAQQSQVVARYAGGDNAGHTVTIADNTFKLHIIPSGILHEQVTCILGQGVVLNPKRFLSEVADLHARGIDIAPQRLMISDRAHLITPGHMALDAASESALGDDAIGTTKRGIGPAYTDKVRRRGLQAGLMHTPEDLGEAIQRHIQEVNETLVNQYGAAPLDADKIAAEYAEYAQQLAPYITNIAPALLKALRQGQRVLCEGAQGTLLDVDMGHYPFVTSSSPSVGGALTGIGFGPTWVDRVVGVTKAFSTRVGSGPMPTELNDAIGDRLRGTGANPWDEYGTTTGRPRRCGWLDGVVLRYAAEVNGFTELILTKLDILSGFETLNIAVAYELDGQRVDYLPARVSDMERATPIYKTFTGWTDDITHVRTWEALPSAARQYVEFIEDMIGIPVTMMSVGPERSQMIVR